MAIVTDQTVTIHGVDVGISKPIQTLIANGDFTYAELSKFTFVGRLDFVNDVAGMYDSYLNNRNTKLFSPLSFLDPNEYSKIIIEKLFVHSNH